MHGRQKLLHVDLKHVEAIAMTVEARLFRNPETGELGCAVDSAVVIGAHHVGRHGFPKAPGSAHADIALRRVDDTIEVDNEPALVDIELGVARLAERSRARIQVHTHVSLPSAYD